MRTVATREHKDKDDFYTSTLAPVDRHGRIRINVFDVAMLTVLFLELAILARFLLAK
jgi:hypothetical protein